MLKGRPASRIHIKNRHRIMTRNIFLRNRSRLSTALILAMSLCGAHGISAKTADVPAAHAYSMRDDEELRQELQRLLRFMSSNIIRMEKGFTVQVFHEKIEFKHLEPLGDEDKRYKISGPKVNGILEMKMGDGWFYDLKFWESAANSPLSVRVIRIDELRLRRR